MVKRLPKILVIGRPNVGKSTFVNKVIGRTAAITLDTPGVTRDIVEYEASWQGYSFLLMDSGGILFEGANSKSMQKAIESQVKQSIEDADKVLFLVDYQTGLNPLDRDVAKMLRPFQAKVALVVNKVDHSQRHTDVADFLRLGLGDPFLVSSIHGNGIDSVLGSCKPILVRQRDEEADAAIRVAIVGRPNVGKSSLINAILNTDRVLVNNEAGTTRDAVDVEYKTQGHTFIFVDTAGIRRQAKVEDGVEYYSVIRSKIAISRADIVVVVVEPEPFMSDQDKKIINLVLEAKKSMILFVNKWDLTVRTDTARMDLERIAKIEMPDLEYYPFIFGSALEKIHIGKLFQAIPIQIENNSKRVSTPELNEFIQTVLRRQPPPAKYGKAVKVYYATQTSIHPPTFVFFVNHPKHVGENYIRFCENRVREKFQHLNGATIQIHFRPHRKEKDPSQ